MNFGKKRTVLFVMARLPFPKASGRKTCLYHYCRILSETLGFRLVVAAFLETGDQPDPMPSFIDRLYTLQKPSGAEKIRHMLTDSLLLGRKPLQVALFWSRNVRQQIDRIVRIEKPDIAIADMVRTTEYIRHLRLYKIADLDDRISLRYQRQLETDISGINPYGAFLYTLPPFMRNVLLWKPLKLFAMRCEIRLLRRYELEVGAAFDVTVFVAKGEAEQFNAELGEQKAKDIPIGVDTDCFAFRGPCPSGDAIGFLGALSVAHNEAAVEHFIRHIFPSILARKPDAMFLVIGGGASDKLRRLATDHITFLGCVDDVRESLGRCKVFVCPMTFGSGIKTKNLEAMAIGLPVVTTSVGAENIHAVSGVDWVIRDHPQDFADAVVELLTEDALRKDMGEKARDFIIRSFTWEVARSRFEEILFN